MKLILYAIAIFWGTWVFYVSIMGLKATRDRHLSRGRRIPWPFKAMAYPTLILFAVADVAFNVVYGSVMFLEPPKEWLFTERVSRWNDTDGWRGKLARWLCENLLDPADPDGKHCA